MADAGLADATGITDEIIVELNGEVVGPKGPAEGRLDNHEAEVAAYEARLAAEAAALAEEAAGE